MERLMTCQNIACRKCFKVSSPGKIADYVDLPDVQAIAFCPYCGSPNRVTWPKGVTFITSQNL